VIRLATDWAGALGEARRAAMLAYADPIGSAVVVTGILHAGLAAQAMVAALRGEIAEAAAAADRAERIGGPS
jgi:hypothetical protein